MAKYSNLSSLFKAIANAIRAKTGNSENILAENFPEAIANISGGGLSVDDIAAGHTYDGISGHIEIYPMPSPNRYEWPLFDYAFAGCTSITSVTANIKGVGVGAFAGCTNLTSVDFRGSSATTADNLFYGCTSLTSVMLYYSDLETVLNKGWLKVSPSAFYNTPIANGTGYIYVPASCVDKFKACSGMESYASQVRAIEDYTVDGGLFSALDPNKI